MSRLPSEATTNLLNRINEMYALNAETPFTFKEGRLRDADQRFESNTVELPEAGFLGKAFSNVSMSVTIALQPSLHKNTEWLHVAVTQEWEMRTLGRNGTRHDYFWDGAHRLLTREQVQAL